MPIFTARQIEILRLLARIGFVTNRHLEQMEIGINPTKNSQSRVMKELLTAGYIARVNVVSGFRIGKRVMYYLTKRGAEFIASIEEIDINTIPYMPVGKDGIESEIVRADFPHKEAYISCFLELEKYLTNTEYEVSEFFHYYQRSKGGTTLTLPKGKNFRPDGIYFLESIHPDEPPYAYVVELHRHSDRKKIIKQLRQHATAYANGSLADRFGKTHSYFVLSIFAGENVAVMRSVIEELQTEPSTWAYMQKYFMFGELDAIMNDGFYEAFAYFGGRGKPLPAKAKIRLEGGG